MQPVILSRRLWVSALAIGLAACAFPAPSLLPPQADAVLWNGDMEAAGWPAGTSVYTCDTPATPPRITFYTAQRKPIPEAPDPRRGNYAVQFRVLAGDTAPCTPNYRPRAQVASPVLLEPGREYWMAWSLYLPRDFPTLADNPTMRRGASFAFRQDYNELGGGAPAIAYYIRPGKRGNVMRVTGAFDDSTKRPIALATLPVRTGRWIDFLQHVRISTDPRVGFFELWVDGRPITLSNGSTRFQGQTLLSNHRKGAQFFLLNYREPGIAPEVTIYFDEAKVGTTRAAVELPASEPQRCSPSEMCGRFPIP